MTPADVQIIVFTMGTAVLAVLGSFPAGVALAWLLARKRWCGKSLVETLLTLPLVMPPVATGLLLLKLFGRRGPIGAWLFETFGMEVVFTWKAVVIALAVMSFPLLVRCLRTAFEEIPRDLEEAAATLGKSPLSVFFRVSLPLARRGIAAGIILAFARALGEFGATVMVAGIIPGVTETLPLAIYRNFQIGDDSQAWWFTGVSAVIAFVAVWISSRFTRGRSPI